MEKIDDELKKKLESIEEILCLSFNNCGLTFLENMPDIKSLVRLELMDNKFAGEQLSYLKKYTSLQSLSLANNNITSYEQLKDLAGLENLIQLDLSECIISELPDYRKKIFEMFSSLHILDNLDSEGNPFAYSDESDAGEIDYDDEDDVDGEEIDEDEEDEDDEGEGEGEEEEEEDNDGDDEEDEGDEDDGNDDEE